MVNKRPLRQHSIISAGSLEHHITLPGIVFELAFRLVTRVAVPIMIIWPLMLHRAWMFHKLAVFNGFDDSGGGGKLSPFEVGFAVAWQWLLVMRSCGHRRLLWPSFDFVVALPVVLSSRVGLVL